MRIYLVRHGKARSADVDPGRGLTAEGREDVRHAAQFLSTRGISVSLIVHSGKLRAEETAHILAEANLSAAGPSRMDDLGPDDEPEALANFLRVYTDDILVVGHLPNLERVAALLLTGNPNGRFVHFENAGIVCLEKEAPATWRLLWAVTPEILRPATGILAA